MSIFQDLRVQVDCYTYLECKGYKVNREGNMKCPIPGHPGDNSGNFSVFDDGARWYCHSHHCGSDHGGDVFDLAALLNFEMMFSQLGKTERRAVLKEIQEIADF